MSNQRTPEPPPTPKGQGPIGPNGKPVKSGGTNWRVIVLMLIGMGIIYMAFNMNADSGNSKEIGVLEFVRLIEKDKVLIDPFEGLSEADSKDRDKVRQHFEKVGFKANDHLTKVTSAGNSFKCVYKGKYDAADYTSKTSEAVEMPFVVRVNMQANSESINALQTSYDIAMELVTELPLNDKNTKTLTLKQLQNELQGGNILLKGEHSVTLQKLASGTDAVFEGNMLVKPRNDAKKPEWQAFTCIVNYNSLSNHDKMVLNSVNPKLDENDGTMKVILMNLLPILLIVFLLFFLFRSQMKNAGKGAMSFGKSKAKMLNQDKNKVTFKDVAGIQEAKEELYEIVDFLRDPKKFEMLGGNIPKGVLMIGSPGTGKTLLARAIAGEAEVPFFSISGSDFVEMFVGVGASRVRDMFEQGKKNSPCIIFIDEIDAVGRHRGQGMGGGNDEREQTLNALLVEMDGFDARSGVIIIAATNRPDVLDPALLRPGRFDRQVRVNLPDVTGREQILAVHAKKVKLHKDVDLSVIAKGTPGFSGAELANLLNEAALLAARTGKKHIKQPELEEARDKVRWGRERRSLALSDKEKENTAYHEAGHAILNIICEHTDPLHKVTIIPRGPALGVTMFLPEEDKFTYRRAELIDQLCVAMGGRVAEELQFGNVTNGAVGDIRQATNIARKMVCEWGMSEKLGMVEYGSDDSTEMFVPGSGKTYSEETAQLIDIEIRQFIDDAYERAKALLIEHREALTLISEALLEYETLDGKQTEDLLYKGVMENPPHLPTPPDPPTPMSPDPVKSDGAISSKKDDDPLDGEVVGAPA